LLSKSLGILGADSIPPPTPSSKKGSELMRCERIQLIKDLGKTEGEGAGYQKNGVPRETDEDAPFQADDSKRKVRVLSISSKAHCFHECSAGQW
jgi:hypothetical protein